MPGQGIWEVGGQSLKLTNLDKVLFPPRPGTDEAPITKRELIDYFARIAPAMLPHLAERPLNLHRFPNGVAKPGFWQKAIPSSAPAWLTTLARVRRRGAGRSHGQRPPRGRRRRQPWCGWPTRPPSRCTRGPRRAPIPRGPPSRSIDIDPGPATTWDETLTLARLYRTALEHLGLQGLPKTTGSRGIQVWIPVTRGRYDFAATSAWVERSPGRSAPPSRTW